VTIAPDPWLSEAAERPVFRIGLDGDVPPADAAGVCLTHQRGHRGAAYYVKVPVDRVAWCRALQPAGFYAVDVNVTFSRPSTPLPRPAIGVHVEVADPAHFEGALDVAGSCFQFSRFHQDPMFPRTTADRIKREWVRSYTESRRGDTLFVALVDGEVAGFLAALSTTFEGRRTAVIDLIGVGRHRQRQGVGRALVETFVNAFASRADLLLVGTQVANVPSVRLYQQCGFHVQGSAYVLHAHAP
jgi:ribosomal protein S18 acetylase RimI-like enzyme